MPVLPGDFTASQCHVGPLGGPNACWDLVCVGEKHLEHPEPTPRIVPMTPSQNDRYERSMLVTPQYLTVGRGVFSPAPIARWITSAGWTKEINPEGSPYFVNKEHHVVTDTPVENETNLQLWIERIAAQANELGMDLPEDYEIYVSPDATGYICRYYFVDHVNCSIFWLEDIDPCKDELDLFPACSQDHLGYLLQEQYWRHCEFFPHHSVRTTLRRELKQVFNQARTDLLTSSFSTFPYGVADCEQFLNILETDNEDNQYSNWTAARLWATIARHRYNTFHGEDYARISRDQRRYDKPAPQRTGAMEIGTVLLFNMPVRRAEELNQLFIDDIAFGMHWRDFAAASLKEWHDASLLAMGLTIANAVSALRPANFISASFGSMSAILALGGLAASALLSQRYAGADKFSAAAAADHLALLEHPTLGYGPIAMIYCLPRGMVFWSMIFLGGHLLSTFVTLQGIIVQLPAMLTALAFLTAMLKTDRILRSGPGV
ncbi:hypothetical protein C8Q73DRAFT_788557 [Cubamyces lactineus]|nr:hypothetical protein C8Q73DRAFT_788557 [Cubamyces lactineus]